MQHYLDEVAGRFNMNDLEVLDRLVAVTVGLVGKHLHYKELTRFKHTVSTPCRSAFMMHYKRRKRRTFRYVRDESCALAMMRSTASIVKAPLALTHSAVK